MSALLPLLFPSASFIETGTPEKGKMPSPSLPISLSPEMYELFVVWLHLQGAYQGASHPWDRASHRQCTLICMSNDFWISTLLQRKLVCLSIIWLFKCHQSERQIQRIRFQEKELRSGKVKDVTLAACWFQPSCACPKESLTLGMKCSFRFNATAWWQFKSRAVVNLYSEMCRLKMLKLAICKDVHSTHTLADVSLRQ